MMRVVLLFLRRLWLPLVFFLGFSLMCVLVYQHLGGLRWPDALVWIFNPHAIEYRRVRDATKFFSILVYFGVFAFQIWVAERLPSPFSTVRAWRPGVLWSTTSASTDFAITSSSAVTDR